MRSRTNPTSKNTSDGEIERVKLDLLSLISHELRTPLTSVLNAIRALSEGGLSEKQGRELLEMANRNAERLNTTLSELLDLSCLVSGRLVCRFHEVPLRYLLTAQIERLKRAAREADLSFRAPALPDLPPLLGDAPRLEQVVRSLFENAVKFSPKGGAIALRIASGRAQAGLAPELRERIPAPRAPTYVVLELSNVLAPGAPRIDTAKIFGVFSQQESVLNRAHEGVGGSLAIGAEVARQHGGALFARSEGGAFVAWLALPVLESEQTLVKVLESRIYALKTQVGGVSLMILEVAGGKTSGVLSKLKPLLFRASDTVYAAGRDEIAVVMDDCKKSDAPKIMRRLLQGLGRSDVARVGVATCPDDATDPKLLLDHARRSLAPI